MTSYDGWADVYDSIYAYVREDIPFYVQEAMRSGGPVLELGCGTGRVTVPIAKSGVDSVGLDNSEGMLEIARSKARLLETGQGKIDLRSGDMRDFSLGRTFPLAIIPFRGFLALLSVEDQVRCLTIIREHLEPDGRLIFNIFVPDPQMLVEDEDAAFHLRDVTDPDTGRTFVLWQQTGVDTFNQVLSVRLIVDEIDRKALWAKGSTATTRSGTPIASRCSICLRDAATRSSISTATSTTRHSTRTAGRWSGSPGLGFFDVISLPP